MATAAATRSTWSRATVATGIAALVAWQALVLVDGPTDAALLLALPGFVLHVLVGKAYALVPSYFARSLTPAWAPAAGLPLTAGGTVALVTWQRFALPASVGAAGAVAWALGVGVFAGSLAWSLRENLTGAETGTGDHDAHRRRLDRYANPYLGVAVGYLVVGAVDLVGVVAGGPTLVARRLAAVAHLLGAGGALLALLAVGTRLLPRLLVASPPAPVAYAMLPAAALGPVLLSSSLGAGPTFVAGAACEAAAVVGFVLFVLVTLRRSDRRRAGFAGVLAGGLAGVVSVGLGVRFALVGIDPALVVAHRRLNLVGLLGLPIVGVAVQFYPPSVGRSRLAGERTVTAALALLGVGLAVEVVGVVATPLATTAGRTLVLAGSALVAAVIFDVFRSRPG
jgi:hypothetical protein